MPTLAELATVAHAHNLLLIDDLGSGTLLDTTAYGLAYEPMVQESIAAGADVVTFSGDKLLGGPQAGIILGRKATIEALRRHPMARALRVDKMTLAALEATLQAYHRGRAVDEIPVWQMIAVSPAALQQRATAWQTWLVAHQIGAAVWTGESAVGGGSLPGETLPTWLLAIPVPQPDAAAVLGAIVQQGGLGQRRWDIASFLQGVQHLPPMPLVLARHRSKQLPCPLGQYRLDFSRLRFTQRRQIGPDGVDKLPDPVPRPPSDVAPHPTPMSSVVKLSIAGASTRPMMSSRGTT
jgi:hypothetical protein